MFHASRGMSSSRLPSTTTKLPSGSVNEKFTYVASWCAYPADSERAGMARGVHRAAVSKPWKRSSPAFVSIGRPSGPIVETTMFSIDMWKSDASIETFPENRLDLRPISPERERSGSRIFAASASRMFGAAGLKLLFAAT